MNGLNTIVNALGQHALGRKKTFRWFQEVEELLAEVCNELHEGSSKRADGRGRRYQALDVAPVNFNPHIIVAAAIASMREAVPSPLAGPPRLEPIGSARSLQLVADVVDQQCLGVLCKGKDSYIFGPEGLFVKQIVLFASIRSGKVMDMMMIGCCNACANKKMSNAGFGNKQR